VKHKLLTPKTLIIALTLSTVLGPCAWALWVTPELKAQGLPPDRETIAQQRTIFVDPDRGSDRDHDGQNEYQAFRTITYALERANYGTVIQLAPGRYAREETFPLQLPDGVTLQGDERQQGAGIEIVGGDFHFHRFWAAQNITIRPGENSQILGVTVTNPNTRGTGIWIETNATVRNSTLKNNNRDGIAIVGTAKPTIENNRFLDNTGNGIFISNEARGEIRDNEFRNTGYGMAIDKKAEPLVQENEIFNNRSGIVITRSARPIVIRNRIENNAEYSIIAVDRAQPILRDNTLIDNGNDTIVMGIPQDNPPTPPNDIASNPTTQFGCMKSGDDLALVAQQGKKTLPRIMFLGNRQIQRFVSVNFCQTVTLRLNDIVADNGNSFNGLRLMHGQLNGHTTVCLVHESQEDCNNNNIVFQPGMVENANLMSGLLEKLVRNIYKTRRYSPENLHLSPYIGHSPNGQMYVNLRDLDKPWKSAPGLWFMDQ